MSVHGVGEGSAKSFCSEAAFGSTFALRLEGGTLGEPTISVDDLEPLMLFLT